MGNSFYFLSNDFKRFQVFGIANSILGDSDDRFLPIRTYKVVPISSRLGVIEFLPNTATYKSMALLDRAKDEERLRKMHRPTKLVVESFDEFKVGFVTHLCCACLGFVTHLYWNCVVFVLHWC